MMDISRDRETERRGEVILSFVWWRQKWMWMRAALCYRPYVDVDASVDVVFCCIFARIEYYSTLLPCGFALSVDGWFVLCCHHVIALSMHCSREKKWAVKIFRQFATSQKTRWDGGDTTQLRVFHLLQRTDVESFWFLIFKTTNEKKTHNHDELRFVLIGCGGPHFFAPSRQYRIAEISSILIECEDLRTFAKYVFFLFYRIQNCDVMLWGRFKEDNRISISKNFKNIFVTGDISMYY